MFFISVDSHVEQDTIEMPRPFSEINVQMFGRRFLRFVLARDDQTYWTGHDWTPHRRQALLYFHLKLAQRERRKLLSQQR